MQKLDFKTKIPIFSWTGKNNLDDGTLRQVQNLANLPFAHHHIALMPDAHVGYGMPIGGVLATKKYIIPNAVGVDIGCGMVAAKTNLNKQAFSSKRSLIANGIANSVPRGFERHDKPQKHKFLRSFPDIPIIQKETSTIKRQLGTMGGGNHFVEALEDTEENVWIMIHSGSRNIGKKIADVYHQKAVHFTKKNFNNYPAKDLSALPADDPDGQEYIEAMQYAQEFAFYNRKRLLEITLKVFTKYLPKTDITREVNIHHNYAVQETHFDQEVWLHRKGAISAKKDQQGIIPGSMATPSYITIGKGNKNSFNSASHGAGRKMSRTQSRKEFTTTTVQELLDKKDIHLKAARKRSMLEEFSGSYKDIKNVIKEQKDLVDIETELHPIMVIIA